MKTFMFVKFLHPQGCMQNNKMTVCVYPIEVLLIWTNKYRFEHCFEQNIMCKIDIAQNFVILRKEKTNSKHSAYSGTTRTVATLLNESQQDV